MTFQNADKLIKKINLMSNEVQGEILKKSVKRGGLLVQKQARLLVNSKSGNLGRSIKERTEQRPSGASSTVYTNLDYGIYYELGTGPNGQENHAGISPNVNPKYSQTGWMIPADAMSVDDAEYYGLGVVESGGEVIGYRTNGMPARPYLYPALHDQKKDITKEMNRYIGKEIVKVMKK